MKVSRCSLNSAPSSRSPIGWRSITSLVLAGLAIFVLGGSMGGQDQDQNQDEDAATIKTILTFGTMIGDPGSATPAAKAKNVIRGYLGPASPWLISSVQGSLKSNGALTVTVRGLVLPESRSSAPRSAARILPTRRRENYSLPRRFVLTLRAIRTSPAQSASRASVLPRSFWL